MFIPKLTWIVILLSMLPMKLGSQARCGIPHHTQDISDWNEVLLTLCLGLPLIWFSWSQLPAWVYTCEPPCQVTCNFFFLQFNISVLYSCRRQILVLSFDFFCI
jgi:hypothetical protein